MSSRGKSKSVSLRVINLFEAQLTVGTDLIHINKQSCYLIGRDRVVADIPIEHPSASKQHAVIQFRQVREKNEFGDVKSLTKSVRPILAPCPADHVFFRPFIIDLESANGTVVNEEKMPESRYYELKNGDGEQISPTSDSVRLTILFQ